MTSTELHPSPAIPRTSRPRRAERLRRLIDAFRRERNDTDTRRRDTRRTHAAVLILLIGLAVATVIYAIVRENAATLLFGALVALQIRLAAVTAFRPPERTDGRDITLIP